MAKPSSHDSILDLERRILCALCRGPGTVSGLNRGTREAAIRALNGYRWRAEEHGVVYEVLARIQPSSGESIAEQLPAQATRMGFPDVDWDLYLRSREVIQPDISELIDALKAAADISLL